MEYTTMMSKSATLIEAVLSVLIFDQLDYNSFESRKIRFD